MGDVIEITQEMLDAARAAGACQIPCKPGDPIGSVPSAHLAWAEDHLPAEARALKLPHPLWTYSAIGYGYQG